jgi:hypothetical protein
MYRRPKFLEVLLNIRQDMSRAADYDVDLFAEMVRSGYFPAVKNDYDLTDKKEEKERKTTKSKIRKLKS